VQVMDAVPAGRAGELQQDLAVNVDAVPSLRITGFAINMTRAPLADPRVRRALNLAVSLPQLIDQAFSGYARGLTRRSPSPPMATPRSVSSPAIPPPPWPCWPMPATDPASTCR